VKTLINIAKKRVKEREKVTQSGKEPSTFYPPDPGKLGGILLVTKREEEERRERDQ